MSEFGAVSLANLSGVKPITAYRAVQLAAYVTAHGGDIRIPSYGGLRTMAEQQQLVQWELDSVAAGNAPYAVHAANVNATHTTGDAFDIYVLTAMNGLTVAETYRVIAVYANALELKAGYFYGGGPPSVKSDPYHFENINRNLYEAPTGGGSGAAPTSDAASGGSLPSSPDGTAGPPGAALASWLEVDPGVAIGFAAVLGVLTLLWFRRREAAR